LALQRAVPSGADPEAAASPEAAAPADLAEVARASLEAGVHAARGAAGDERREAAEGARRAQASSLEAVGRATRAEEEA
jgi:hypothetical protein